MSASPDRIEALRRRLARIEDRQPVNADRFDLGHHAADAVLGGLSRRGLHEIYPGTSADMASADGFALGLAARAAKGGYIVWVAQAVAVSEAGLPYGEGLKEWGLDPGRVLFVRTPDARSLLVAAEDALKSGAVAAVMMSVWGEPRVLGLTAERRLSLAAQTGSMALLVRAHAEPSPGAAETRWSIRSVSSKPLEADAPGRPTLGVKLVRSRTGAAPEEWIMEWDNETKCFVQPAPISGGMVPLPADRPAAAMGHGDGLRGFRSAARSDRQDQRGIAAFRR